MYVAPPEDCGISIKSILIENEIFGNEHMDVQWHNSTDIIESNKHFFSIDGTARKSFFASENMFYLCQRYSSLIYWSKLIQASGGMHAYGPIYCRLLEPEMMRSVPVLPESTASFPSKGRPRIQVTV